MQQHKNILIIEVDEANLAMSENAAFLSLANQPDEALRRYQALAEVRLAQLVGLNDCHVRFVVTPADGVDAVRFWLLPMLRGDVQALTASTQIYQFTPEQHAPSFTIDFAVDEGDLTPFTFVARMNFFCIECGARWINLAIQQCSASKSVLGDGYLSVEHTAASADRELVTLLEYPIVQDDEQWKSALAGPIGGKLDQAYKRQ